MDVVSTAAHKAPDAASLARVQAGMADLLSGIGAPAHRPAPGGEPRSAEVRPPRFRVFGLKGSAIAFVVALVASRHRRPLLLVTPTQKEAERLAEDVAFFLGDQAAGGASASGSWRAGGQRVR